jgi:hypothetical protein
MQRSSQNFTQVDVLNEEAWVQLSNQVYINKETSGAVFNTVQTSNDASAVYGMRMSLANAGAGKEYGFWFAGSEIDSTGGGNTQVQRVLVKTAAGDRYIYLYSD